MNEWMEKTQKKKKKKKFVVPFGLDIFVVTFYSNVDVGGGGGDGDSDGDGGGFIFSKDH